MHINKINPAALKITDMRFADIDGAPKRCTLMKLYTNQGDRKSTRLNSSHAKTSRMPSSA